MMIAAMLVSAAQAGEIPADRDGNQWISWRGPENLGASRATGLIDKWENEDGPAVLWKADAGGRATPVIMDGRVFVQLMTGEGAYQQEEVVCLDADTGRILWRHGYDIFHTDIPSDRVGWACPALDAETGNVYVHGVQGIFLCLDRDGKVLWRKSLTEEYGRISGYGGRTHTPILDGDMVIVSFLNTSLGPQGAGRHRYLAMDKRTGEVIWWATPGGPPLDTTFSVPAVAVINGVRQLIAGNADGWVYGMKIATGEKIWGFKLTKRGINASVLVHGDKVYAMHGEDNFDTTTMGRIVCIDATGQGDVTETHEVWRHDEILTAYSSPALAEGRLYCADKSNNLIALDAETGKEYWTLNAGREGWGSPVWADGKIFLPEVDGKFHIIEPGDSSARIVSTIHFEDPGRDIDIRGCAAIAYGRIYLQTRNALYCIGSKDRGEAIELDPGPEAGSADSEAVSLQVVPADVRIKRGETVKFNARLFDAKGRLIGPAKGIKGSHGIPDGSLSVGEDRFTFTAEKSANGQFGLIEVTLGDLKTQVRVHVLADLPIEQNFDSLGEGKQVSDWIGCSRVKFMTVIEDGDTILKKDADNIKFQNASVFFGSPDMSNYTIQADVRMSEKRRRLPEVGLINSRYQFDLRGNNEDLRLIGWLPMARVSKIEPFIADPDVWYTMKLRVEYEGDKAIVRGKIWEREKPEPEAWTIELEDPHPYRNGNPGLVCKSFAELYYDNIKVTSN